MTWGFQMCYYSSKELKGGANMLPVKVGGQKTVANCEFTLIKCSLKPKMSDFFSRPPTLKGHSFAAS